MQDHGDHACVVKNHDLTNAHQQARPTKHACLLTIQLVHQPVQAALEHAVAVFEEGGVCHVPDRSTLLIMMLAQNQRLSSHCQRRAAWLPQGGPIRQKDACPEEAGHRLTWFKMQRLSLSKRLGNMMLKEVAPSVQVMHAPFPISARAVQDALQGAPGSRV